MSFFKCRTPKELIESIEKNPTYILLKRWSVGYRCLVGKSDFIKMGCKEPIVFEQPRYLSDNAFVRFFQFTYEGYDISGCNCVTEDYFINIENILLWCKKQKVESSVLETAGVLNV